MEQVIDHLGLAYDNGTHDRESIIEACFEGMEAGATLNAVALQYGITPATVWRWISASPECIKRYEHVKVARSRCLMEHGLYEIQCAQTLDDVKLASYKAKHYLMMAARLNPGEFSDKVHAMQQKQGGQRGAISFTLNFPGVSEQQRGELTVIAQPLDGDLP